MQKILVASSKGGCGKTTLATNLAAHEALAGRNTVLVDADRQGSGLHWCEKRAPLATPVLPLAGLRRDWPRHVPEGTDRVVIDSPAGIQADEVAELVDAIDAVLVPILPSTIDLEATSAFLSGLAKIPAIKRGRLPVGLVANRLKPWTNATQQALEAMRELPFPVVAELRDTQAYVLVCALGKSIFDYQSELLKSHQDDWSKLFRWLKRAA